MVDGRGSIKKPILHAPPSARPPYAESDRQARYRSSTTRSALYFGTGCDYQVVTVLVRLLMRTISPPRNTLTLAATPGETRRAAHMVGEVDNNSDPSEDALWGNVARKSDCWGNSLFPRTNDVSGIFSIPRRLYRYRCAEHNTCVPRHTRQSSKWVEMDPAERRPSLWRKYRHGPRGETLRRKPTRFAVAASFNIEHQKEGYLSIIESARWGA